MLIATKVRLYPTAEQRRFLNGQFGAVRFCYNKAVALKRDFYRKKGISLSVIKEIKPLLSVAKKSRKYGWLFRKQFGPRIRPTSDFSRKSLDFRNLKVNGTGKAVITAPVCPLGKTSSRFPSASRSKR